MKKHDFIIYLFEPSHVDYLRIINPMFLLAVTCIYIAYIVSYSPLACLGFVSSMRIYILCFLVCLILCYLACVGCHAHHVVVFVAVSRYSTLIKYYLALVRY